MSDSSKAHLDQAMATARLEVGSAKAWEPYRSYEKRLAPGASKAKGAVALQNACNISSDRLDIAKRPPRAKIAANGDLVSEEEAEVEGLVSASENEQPPPSQRPRPRPRPKHNDRLRSSDEEGELDELPASGTPRRKRVAATYVRTPQRNGAASVRGGDQDVDGMGVDAEAERVVTPVRPINPNVPNFKSKRKRIRME